MNGQDNRAVVRMPLGRRLRLCMPAFLPMTLWLASLAAVAVLLGRQQQYIGLFEGTVEVHEVVVAPLDDGILRGLTVDLHDRVAADQVVALMDDTLARAELLSAEVALQRLRADLETARAGELQTGEDRKADRRRFMADMESARLAYLDRMVRQERDKVDLLRLEVRAQQERELAAHGLLDEFTYDQTRLEFEALQTQLREHEVALRESRARVAEVERRLAEFDGEDGGTSYPPLFESLARSITAQERLLTQLSEKLAYLSLRSPISGSVTRIAARPGTTVLAGMPVVHIADPNGVRVVAHIPEERPITLAAGAPVTVFTRHNAKEAVAGRVLSIGPAMEEVPVRQGLGRGLAPPVGRPVLVGDLPPDAFVPGQSVVVRPRQGGL